MLPGGSRRPTSTLETAIGGQPASQQGSRRATSTAGPAAVELEQMRLQYEELQAKHWNALRELQALQSNALR